MNTTPENGNARDANQRRTTKWIFWNTEHFGRQYIQQGDRFVPVQREEPHWINRFKGDVWWNTLRGLFWLMKEENASEPTLFQGFLFYCFGVVASSLPAILVVLALVWTTALAFTWQWIMELVKSTGGCWVAFTVLLAVGSGAYALRRWFRGYYGGAELVFAVIAIWLGLQEASMPHPNTAKVMLSVVGGLYVMVRALDNIEQGWKEAGRIYAEITRRPTRREIEVSLDDLENQGE